MKKMQWLTSLKMVMFKVVQRNEAAILYILLTQMLMLWRSKNNCIEVKLPWKCCIYDIFIV